MREFRLGGMAILLSASVLAGCTSTGGTTTSPDSGAAPVQRGWLSGLFPSATPPALPQPEAQKNTPETSEATPAYRVTVARCPQIEVKTGTETLRAGDPKSPDDPDALRWQATIGQIARECRTAPNEAGYTVGVQVRVLLGPAGAPGTYDVPLRIALLRGSDHVISSTLNKVAVTIPANEVQGAREFVTSEIVIPREPGDSLANLHIIVGFDPMPATPARPARRHGTRHRR